MTVPKLSKHSEDLTRWLTQELIKKWNREALPEAAHNGGADERIGPSSSIRFSAWWAGPQC